MPRYTSAYSDFVMALGEVQTLQSLALRLERIDPLRETATIRALCRGAIVLLSGHLESYVKSLGSLVVQEVVEKQVDRSRLSPRFYYHISKDLIAELRETTDPDKLARKMFEFLELDGNHWERTGPFPSSIDPDRFNKGFSNPAYDKIAKYLGRFGHSTYRKDLAGRLTSDYLPITNMVNHLVDTRNQIAHGDPRATKTPREVRDMTCLIRKFARATDIVFGDWCRNNLCAIRIR